MGIKIQRKPQKKVSSYKYHDLEPKKKLVGTKKKKKTGFS